MFALAACQEELQQPVEQPVVPGVEGELQEVTFSVSVPQDPQTKAISDGMKATNLEYAVYRAEAYSYTDEAGKTETYPAGEYIPALSQGANAKVTEMHSTDQLKWEVVLTLAKNVKYDIVFWAYADKAPYTFDEENATITVDDKYEGPANAENRDAFFFRCDDYAVITSDTKVELRRPFAQINFGSSDYVPYITGLNLKMTSTFDTDAHAAKDAVYENDDPNGRLLYPAVPSVGATKLPTVLNVLDGTVSGEAVVNFVPTPIPYETGDQVLMVTDADGDETTTADQTTYHWMAMNYVLAGEEATINNIHAVFTYNKENLEINVPNVPFKRNYRTNILGNLFTGEAKFNVIVVPDYYKPDYIYDMDLTLAEAFTQNRDVEFTMTENTVIEEPLILENGKTLTLNLDEYSITTETDLWDAAKKVWSMISVRNGSKLVINSKGGKVVAKENDAYAIDVQGGSTVTINGGEYVGNISSVYVLEGTANINGGSYSIQQVSEPANGGDYRFTLNCEDAAYKAGNAVINVTGGSFVNFDPSNNLAEGAGTDFLADGYKAVSKKDNGETVYTVVELNPIEKAVAAGANTVVLSEDLVLDETIAVASELTIDLGGKALSTETTPAFLANANLTIKSGTANVAKELVRVGAGVTVTLDDVTATSEGDNCVFVPKESKDAAVVVADGTSLTSKGAAAIQSNGNTEGLKLTIAGTVVSEGDVAVYLPQVEKCTVASTAKISGVTGIEIRAGELVVEDGAEISAGNEFEAKANGNGSTIKGAAIAASAHSTNLPLSVTINGGTFNCVYALYETYLESAERTAKTTLAVKGGTFNAPIFSKNCEGFVTGGTFAKAVVENLIAEGYMSAENGDGTYSIVVKPAVTVTPIKDVEAGKEYTVEGTVVAVGVDGYVVADEDPIFVYAKNHGRKLNEKVQLTGLVSQNYANNVMQFSSPAVTVLEEDAAYTYSPRSVDGAAIDAAVASGTATCEEVTFTGTLSVSGTYVNITVDGATKQGSLKYITASDYSSLASKKVVVKGYVTSTYNYYSVLPYSVELMPADWALRGLGGDWNTDYPMYEDGDWYVAENVSLSSSEEFKFSKDNWSDNRGGQTSVGSSVYYAGKDWGNITVSADGTYDIYLNKNLSYYSAVPAGSPVPEISWTLYGPFGETSDWIDTDMTYKNGWYVLKDIALSGEFLLRLNKEWNLKLASAGTELSAIDTEIPVAVNANANLKSTLSVANGELYDLYLKEDLSVIKAILATTVEPTVIFEETFAGCTGTMGWSDNAGNGTFKPDNEGWTTVNPYGAGGSAKFGASKKIGSAETPALNITGTATLKFKAGAWTNDNTTLNLSMTNGTLSQATVTLKNAEWTEYEVTITNAEEGAKIKFEGNNTSKARFFLDDIVITQ